MLLPDPIFAPYGDHKVAYHSYGTGSDAVVFIHGWTCDSSLWEGQQPLFEKYKRTVLVDYLGHGNSDAPDIDYSMETLALSVKAALDHAGVEKAVFVSHSMGGPVSTMVLRLFTDMVKAIIYVDSFFNVFEHYYTNVELVEVRKRTEDDARFQPWVRAICLDPKGGEVTDKIVKRMMSTPKHVRVSCVGTQSRPHLWRFDEKYEIPAVQIATVMANLDPWWKDRMPRLEVQVEEWKDCKHWPFMDQPERFNKTVEKWIEEKGLLQTKT